MTVELFDFHKPGPLPDDIGSAFTSWRGTLCQYAPERLLRLLSETIEFSDTGTRTSPFGTAIRQLPEFVVAQRVSFGSCGLTTLLIFPRHLALAMVLQMLSGAETETADDRELETAEDRELTAVESTLCELIFRELGIAFGEAWPGQTGLASRVDGPEDRPERTKLFQQTETVVVCEFRMSGSFGEGPAFWILPLEPMEELISMILEPSAGQSAGSRQMMEMRCREISVGLTVLLGEARVHVSDLARMQADDVLVLNQRIADPLPATLANSVKFYGWGGRSGNRQAYKITSLVDNIG